MSGNVWKQSLSPRCVYVYGDGLETFPTDHTDVEGSCAAVSIPDPADQRGGRRLLLLFQDKSYVQSCLERKCIIYQGTELRVEICNNACDIPDEWEQFVVAPSQTHMQYPSTESGPQQNEIIYTNLPSRQDIQHFPMPDPQMYQNTGGQQMPFPPGQQNPMNPAQYPYMIPFPHPGFMLPQEGATAQGIPAEGGNFHVTPQMMMQQMQILQMFEKMKAGAAPPPYSVTEEEAELQGGSLPISRSQGSEPEVAMIKVTHIPSGTSEDSLLFFFENRRKSGGGSITDIEYDPDTQSAVITFEEPEAIKRILAKMPILFSGAQIGVEEFQPDLKVDSPVEEPVMESGNILEVRGVSSRTSSDTVEMYFENAHRSGGGEIKSIEEKDGMFYIVFQEEDIIENVLRKRHNIGGTAIEVCRYVPPPPPKPVPMYPNKVFIKNISEKTTKDELENFLEAKTGITPTSIEYGELEGAALVTFEEDLDFEKLQLACKKRSLNKSYFEVSRVPITNCVIVRNISGKTSQDILGFYFDNKRKSGVTGVLDVKLFNGFCLVYFEEPQAVNLVCKRQHKVDGQDLDVKIYYECLGQVENDEEGPFVPPDPLELTDLDAKKLQFLIKSPPNQQAVEKQLETVHGKPVWPKKSKAISLTVECTLTAETKDCRKLARTWEANVKRNLNVFLDLLLVNKHTTSQEAFPLVVNEFKSLTINDPDAVAVFLEKSNHEIYVTGHIQASQELSKIVNDIIQKVEKEMDNKKQQKKKSIQETDLKVDPSMMKYLSMYCPDPSSKTLQSSMKDSAELRGFEENCGTDLKSFQHFVECVTCGSYSEFYCNNCHQRMCENCKAKHLVDPDNQKHEITLYSQRKKKLLKHNCKLHPTKVIDLCCNDCQEALCSLCTTNENHRGHHFLDLERVLTEQTTTCLKDICRIRDDILPKSQDLLENTKTSLDNMKRQLKNIRKTMQEQAKQLKNLVDEVLSKNMQVLGDLEASVISGLSVQEETLSAYVSNMQQILEELQTSISSASPFNIVKHMKKNTGISINPIPVVTNYPLPVFTEGVLCKEEITKQFGSLQMEGQGLSSPT